MARPMPAPLLRAVTLDRLSLLLLLLLLLLPPLRRVIGRHVSYSQAPPSIAACGLFGQALLCKGCTYGCTHCVMDDG
jgi:hypothetical protein